MLAKGVLEAANLKSGPLQLLDIYGLLAQKVLDACDLFAYAMLELKAPTGNCRQ